MTDVNILTIIIKEFSYGAIFFTMLLEGACMPFPSELILGFTGYLVFQGKLSLLPAILAGSLGSLTGSFMMYCLARYKGRKLLYKWGPAFHLTPERINLIASWFTQYGPVLIIPWRLLPIIRPKISIAAGLLKMKKSVFVTFSAIGIILWCTVGILIGQWLGNQWSVLIELIRHAGYLVLAGTIFTVLFLVLLYARTRRARAALKQLSD